MMLCDSTLLRRGRLLSVLLVSGQLLKVGLEFKMLVPLAIWVIGCCIQFGSLSAMIVHKVAALFLAEDVQRLQRKNLNAYRLSVFFQFKN